MDGYSGLRAGQLSPHVKNPDAGIYRVRNRRNTKRLGVLNSKDVELVDHGELQGNPRRWGWTGGNNGGAGVKRRTRLCVYSKWDERSDVFTEQLRVMTRSGVAVELEFLKTLDSWLTPPTPTPPPGFLMEIDLRLCHLGTSCSLCTTTGVTLRDGGVGGASFPGAGGFPSKRKAC